jgi:hypothetical protein
MIYVHGLTGRNVYTKLDDVLDINRPIDQLQKKGFDQLEKAVNDNYKTFSQNMIMKQSKQPMQPFS